MLAVSLGPFAAGIAKGYSSPALASLQSGALDSPANGWSWNSSQSNHYSVTTLAAAAAAAASSSSSAAGFSVSAQQGSWIASLSLLGALLGGPFGGVAMKFGRKRTLLSITIPFSLFWLLTVFASCVAMIYTTAFVCGFCSAVVLLVTHVYISEIASPEIRGGLCAVTKITSHIGLLVSYSLGAYLDWKRLAVVATAAPIMLLIGAMFVPETPSFLLSLKGREQEAWSSLQWLRGQDVDVSDEFNTIQANLKAARASNAAGHYRHLMRQKRFLRPLLITCGMMMFQRLCGAHAFSFYAAPIFRATFAGMNPHAAAVVVGFVQLVAAITSGLLIDTVGRLPLLITSNVLMTLALASFGTYIFFQGGTLNGPTPSSLPAITAKLDWIPLLCVLTFTVAFQIGVGPIAWLYIGELYPLEYRSVGAAMTTSFSYICSFVSVKTFVDLEAWLGLHGAFWIYASISIFGLIFVLICVPETRGRDLDEMEIKSLPISH